MSRVELLNNITHKNLKVSPIFSKEQGDNVASTLVFVTEFSELQKEYPIFFREVGAKKELQAVVLLGIQKDENLFLTDKLNINQQHPGWNGNYVPAALARGPFSIGIQKNDSTGTQEPTPVIHIEIDHPKVSEKDGIAVFSDNGGNSYYLNQMIKVLNKIRDGISLNKAMFKSFKQYELIEDVNVDIELRNQSKYKLSGFKTINADKLSALSGDALKTLNNQGFLQAAVYVVASLPNINKLIYLKNIKSQHRTQWR